MFLINLVPYYQITFGHFLYADIYRKNPLNTIDLIGISKPKETLFKASIRNFSELTGIYLNPICFQPLMTTVTRPRTDIDDFILDDEIIMIPEYYCAVKMPHLTKQIVSKQIIFQWKTYEEITINHSFLIDQYAYWELNYRLTNNKMDILPNRLQTHL